MKNRIILIFLAFFSMLMVFSCKKQAVPLIFVNVVPDLKDTGFLLPGVSALAFNSDDTAFAAGTGEGSLFIWDITRGRRIRVIRAADNAIKEIAFSSDGKFVIAEFSSSQRKVFDIEPEEAVEVTRAKEEDFPRSFGMKFTQSEGVLQFSTVGGQKSLAVPEKIIALAVNNDSTRALTGSDNGITRLWNLQTGEEIVRYISFGEAPFPPSQDTGEWIGLLPGGYYNASARGAELMKVESGGEEMTMAQFAASLFRPDLQSKAVREGGTQAVDTLLELLAPENAPPLIEIIGPKSLNVKEGSASVRVKISAGAGGVGRMTVTRGGSIHAGVSVGETLVGYMALDGLIQRQYEKKGKRVYEIAFNVPLEPGKNSFGISVFGERRKRESKPVYIDITTSWAGEKAGKPDLHVLLMSIETYKNAGSGGISNLRYTTDDADALGELFAEQKKGSLYRDVKIYQYADNEITREGFGKIFEETAAKVGRNDSFVFFFAGHGFVDSASGDFFFIPYDSIGFFDNPMENNIVMDDIVGGIASVHAKNSLMLFDTCQSGTLLESGDTAFERLIQRLNQKAIITATMGNQDAIESRLIGHGIFTVSLLDSYNDKLENQFSTAADLIAFTRDDVPQKFSAIMEEAKTRGIEVLAIPQTQKPLSWMPKENFRVFDRYTEPGIIEIRSVTAGTLSVFGLPGETSAIRAGRSLEKRLKGGTYQISVEYPDKHLETKEVTVANTHKPTGASAFKPRKETVSFEYKPAPAIVAPLPDLPPAPASAPSEMVRINGGTFTMGSPAGEAGRRDSEVQHQITVSSFYMGKYEVTQNEYQEIMGTNPSNFKGDNFPVEQVSWYEAIEYCNKRSQKEGLTPAYTINGTNVTWNRNANGYRLPTEAEWEYACRAGTTTAYNTGTGISDNTGWYSANSSGSTKPVGQKPANAWGLHDMHGNVYEWCWDWYAAYPAGAQTDPMGASSGSSRMSRGGGWNDSAAYVRSASRSSITPSNRYYSLGFRLVRP